MFAAEQPHDRSLLDPLSEALSLLDSEPASSRALYPHWQPEVALEESDDTLVIRVSLPGTEPEDVRVRIADDLLTLEAERRGGPRRGRGFVRSFLLPVAVRPEAVDAALHDGVLRVTVDKHCELRRRRISVA